jgi:hypothetical protein
MKLEHTRLCIDLINKEKFWSRVNRSGCNECWPWTGGRRSHKGFYGAFHIKIGEAKFLQESAHRIAWMITNNRPIQLQILHKCDNGICCNPAHLYEGTQKRNIKDSVERKRHYKTKLSVEQVREIRSMKDINQSEVARQLGVNSGTISRVYNRHTFSWIE